MFYYKQKIRLLLACAVLLIIICLNSCGAIARFDKDYLFIVVGIDKADDMNRCDYRIKCFDEAKGQANMGAIIFVVQDSIGKYKIGEYLELVHSNK